MDAVERALLAKKGPIGETMRAAKANPIQLGESREAWDDRVARAVRVAAKTWTATDEQAYSARYAARLSAEAEARRLAEEQARHQELIDAINRNTDARRKR
jgi:hypothetical protein